MRHYILSIAALIMACSTFVTASDLEAKSRKTYRNKTMGIVAHRGFWNCEEAGYARNSIAALRCAQENGFWGSEFDVNMTADEVLIVFHDSDIHGKRIEKHPYSEFLDVTLENGEKIPTIDQYLEQGSKYPETMLVYELKPHLSDKVEDRLVELSIAKLKEYELLDPHRVMFISFSYHICRKIAAELPEFTVQYLGSDKDPEEVCKDGINGIDYHYNALNSNPSWAAKARQKKMSTNAWTVNNEENMVQMIEKGIMYLTTDNPLTARKVLEENGVEELR